MDKVRENGKLNLLYIPEHVNCQNYETNSGNPVIEKVEMRPNERRLVELHNAEMLFIIKGDIKIYTEDLEKEVGRENILFLPPGSRMNIECVNESSLIFMSLKDNIKLCQEYTLSDLDKDVVDRLKGGERLFPLPFNNKIRGYLTDFMSSYNDGLRCIFYIDIKLKELFYLLRGYYNKEALYHFFNPIVSHDIEFSLQVWNQYRDAASVGDLANITNYSVSHFQNKFREIFGESALQWLNTQKARNIFFDLRMTDKPFKQISEEYHFASASYLSTFCKRNFDLTPRQIREHC